MAKLLEGTKVIEMGTMITAPLAAMMLADLGAEVIKIERPEGGDPFRSFRGTLYSPTFVAYNRNKRSLTLDVRSADGREIMGRLLASADVLVENYRPGVLTRMGFPDDELHARYPRLIRCSITGYGATGPKSARPAYDGVASALSGLWSLFLNPDDPETAGPTIADNATGMYACYGILGALVERTRTGKGRRVEVNMLESAIAFMPDAFANTTLMNIENTPRTRVSTSHSFAVRCADGRMLGFHVSSQQKFWEALVKAIERPDLAADPRFATRAQRIANFSELEGELKTIFATRPSADWVQPLEDNDVPFAPVQTIPEVIDDEQVRHLKTFYAAPHPTHGDVVGINRPVLIDGGREIDIKAPPTLGQDNAAVLGELGYDADHIARLKKQGTI